jgi:glycolate oxidase
VGILQRPALDLAILNERPRILRDLERLIGKASVISDDDGCRSFETDALTAYAAKPLAVVLASSTEDVSKTLAYCHAHAVKVVPRGACPPRTASCWASAA